MLTGILAASVTFIFLAGAAAAVIANSQEQRQTEARDTYNLIVLRNGVTATSPFHSLRSPMNVPGMVQVYPQTQTPTPTPPAPSPSPVPAAARLEALPTASRQPVEDQDDARKITSTKETKFKWGYPQGGFEASAHLSVRARHITPAN